MVFSDLFFLFAFVPTFLVCYFIAAFIDKRRLAAQNGGFIGTLQDPTEQRHAHRIKNSVLVCFSLLFYAWGEPVYVFLMIGCVVMNYFVGRGIDRSEGRRRKAFLAWGVALNIAILAVFKYLGFLAQSLFDVGVPVPVPQIALPIGISFYIFQSISYLADVYRRDARVQHNFADLLLYISMFPQMIAGPIVRYQTVAEEIYSRRVSARDFSDGAYRFFIGLGKKVILANQLSEVSDQFLTGAGLAELSVSGAWLGVTAFALQIYFDFSGYSDMAIGLGRCIGFHFNENFRHPYCCNSITDFWRRWHISLGSFFRDYVYIPMGGNRRHQFANIMCVWFLTGMWHGASWNFIIWGLYFGIIILTEKYTLLKVQNRIPSPLLHIYSLAVVLVGWGIFYFDDFSQMTFFFQAAIGNNPQATSDVLTMSTLQANCWLFVVALLFCMPVRSWLSALLNRYSLPEGTFNQTVRLTVRLVVSLTALFLCTALLVGATNNAFIYTRF